MPEIIRFEDHPSLREAFIGLPYRLHAADPQWIAPSRDAVRAQLAPTATFRGHGRMVHFMAMEGREPVARCSAILNDRYRDDEGPLGMIGYFEAVPDYKASEAVLGEALSWLEREGATRVRGPMNTSTYHPYRFLTKGFEHGTFFLEPYNPAYYPEHWERFGFRPVMAYASLRASNETIATNTAREYARTLAAGFHARHFDPARFEDELRLMYDLSTRIFTGAWMWRPLDFAEFRAIYAGMKQVLIPDLCFFLYQEAEPVGFVFGLPDYAASMRSMKGRSDLGAKLGFLANRGKARQALLKTFGVVPDIRTGAHALALSHLFHQAAQAHGYADTVHALMRADNVSLKMSRKKGAEPYKEYALYGWREEPPTAE